MKSKIERIREAILFLTHKEHRISMKINLGILEKENKEQHEKELKIIKSRYLNELKKKRNLHIRYAKQVSRVKDLLRENQKLKKHLWDLCNGIKELTV